MGRTRALNEVIRMRFLDIYLRYQRDSIGCDEAADLLGVSVSSFYRLRKRFDAEGEDGLVDRRLGKLSARRAPVDEAVEVKRLFKSRYYDFNVKHFHEKLTTHADLVDVHLGIVEVVAVHHDGAGADVFQAVDGAQQGGFARAARTDDDDLFPGCHVETDVGQGGHLVVILADVRDGDDGVSV